VEQDKERDVYAEPLHNEISDANMWLLLWETIGISGDSVIGSSLSRLIRNSPSSAYADSQEEKKVQASYDGGSAKYSPAEQNGSFPGAHGEGTDTIGNAGLNPVQVSKGYLKYADDSILHLNNKFIFLRVLVMVNFGNLYVMLSGTLQPNLTVLAALYLVIFLCPLLVPSWAKTADVILVILLALILPQY